MRRYRQHTSLPFSIQKSRRSRRKVYVTDFTERSASGEETLDGGKGQVCILKLAHIGQDMKAIKDVPAHSMQSRSVSYFSAVLSAALRRDEGNMSMRDWMCALRISIT